MQSGWTGIPMPLPMLSSSTVHQRAGKTSSDGWVLATHMGKLNPCPMALAQHSPGSWRHLRSESTYRALSLSFCHLSLKYMKKKNDPYDPQVPLHSDSATFGKLFSMLPPISWYWTRLQGSPSLLLILVPNYFLLPTSGLTIHHWAIVYDMKKLNMLLKILFSWFPSGGLQKPGVLQELPGDQLMQIKAANGKTTYTFSYCRPWM